MTHPIELFAADLIHKLRYEQTPVYASGELKLSEGAYFSWDAEKSDMALRVRPELGSLFRAQAKVLRKPRWCTVNFSLGAGSLEPGAVLGVLAEVEGCEGQTVPLFIRALQDGALSDIPFVTPLKGSATSSVQTLLLTVTEEQALSRPSDFLTLVFNLPKEDFALTLRNLAVFVLPPQTARP